MDCERFQKIANITTGFEFSTFPHALSERVNMDLFPDETRLLFKKHSANLHTLNFYGLKMLEIRYDPKERFRKNRKTDNILEKMIKHHEDFLNMLHPDACVEFVRRIDGNDVAALKTVISTRRILTEDLNVRAAFILTQYGSLQTITSWKISSKQKE